MSEVTPAAVLIGLSMQYWHSLAILAAANLGIADEIGATPREVDTMAGALQVHPQTLFRLMRGLSSKGIFRQTGERSFGHSPLSQALRSGAPGGAREIIRSLVLGSTRAAATAYEDAIATGRSAFEIVLGDGPLAQRVRHPQEASIYDAGMTAAAVTMLEAIHDAFDFSRYPVLVDVGGGKGTVLASILAKNPNQRGILFDTAAVVDGCFDVLDGYGVRDRCEVHAGDFTTEVPARGDAYILKNVLHGYGDAHCVDLLKRIQARANPGAHVLIIELVMPSGPPPMAHATFDLFLLLGGADSHVRSETEFRELLALAGFTQVLVVPTAASACIIDASVRG